MNNERLEVQRCHALRRAQERYGVTMTIAHYNQLAMAIENGHSQFVHQEYNGREWHQVEYCGRMMLAVYIPVDRIIVTFLPPNAKPRV